MTSKDVTEYVQLETNTYLVVSQVSMEPGGNSPHTPPRPTTSRSPVRKIIEKARNGLQRVREGRGSHPNGVCVVLFRGEGEMKWRMSNQGEKRDSYKLIYSHERVPSRSPHS